MHKLKTKGNTNLNIKTIKISVCYSPFQVAGSLAAVLVFVKSKMHGNQERQNNAKTLKLWLTTRAQEQTPAVLQTQERKLKVGATTDPRWGRS